MNYHDVERKLKEELGERYKIWYTKEVIALINKGYDGEKVIASYIKRLNKNMI